MALVFLMTRHGESEQNLANRSLYKQDWDEYRRLRSVYKNPEHCSLTEAGKQQAMEVAPIIHNFAKNRNDKKLVVYSSPYTRAKQTAEIICEDLNVEIIVDPRIRERSWGPLEHNVHSEDTYDQVMEAGEKFINSPTYKLPGGESIADRYGDIKSFIDDVQSKHADDWVFVFAHGEVMRMTQMIQSGAPLEDWPKWQGDTIKNCHTEAWSKIDPLSGTIQPKNKWRSLVYCRNTNPNGKLVWEKLH